MHNRRSFLKLGAGAAIGGIAAALPATAATKECAANIQWDETRDIIVVGSGFAGLSSALNAKRQGLGSVLVLEKMQVIGGNSAINGGWLAIPKNPIQLAQGINDDSPEELVKDQIISGRGMQNTDMLRQMANRALDAYQLCIDAGVKFREGF
ncbi:MAG: FAD-dependent oxidoreductase, partial [Shewanella sp.]